MLPLFPALRTWLSANKQASGPIVRRQRILDGDESLFIKPHCLESARRRYNADQDDLREEGKDHSPHLPNFHICRHTLATLMIAEGRPLNAVSAMLRHSNTRTTERFYINSQAMNLRDQIQDFDV